MHTKWEILKEIEALEQIMNRAGVADANSAELRRDDLLDIVRSMKDYQLADVGDLMTS